LAISIELLVEGVEGERWSKRSGGIGAPFIEEKADGALGAREEEEFRARCGRLWLSSLSGSWKLWLIAGL